MVTKFAPWQQEKIISAGGSIMDNEGVITLAHRDCDERVLTIVEDGKDTNDLFKLVESCKWLDICSLEEISLRVMLLKLGFSRDEWKWGTEGLYNIFYHRVEKNKMAILPGAILVIADFYFHSKNDAYKQDSYTEEGLNCVVIDLFSRLDLLTNNLGGLPGHSNDFIEDYGWIFTYQKDGRFFLEEAVNKALEVSAERFPTKKHDLQSNSGSLLTPAELEAFQTVGNVISSLGERLSAISASSSVANETERK